jgi:hypothetical protein
MYKPTTYLVVTYFPTYLFIFRTYFLVNGLPRQNQILTQISGHPVDRVLVGAGSLWFNLGLFFMSFVGLFLYDM